MLHPVYANDGVTVLAYEAPKIIPNTGQDAHLELVGIEKDSPQFIVVRALIARSGQVMQRV